MLNNIRQKFQTVRQALTRLDDQPIGAAALTVVLLLDLFILSSIFRGLSDHTAQLASPSEVIPGYCRELVLDGGWNTTERLPRLSQVIEQHSEAYLRTFRYADNDERHPLCQFIAQSLQSIALDKALSAQLSRYLNARSQLDSVQSEQQRIKGLYDSALLESMASATPQSSERSAMAERNRELTQSIESLVTDESSQATALHQQPLIAELFAQMDAVTAQDKAQLRNDLRQLNLWYPAKRLGMEMLFLMPLLLIFYFWNARSVAGHRPLQTLVSSHLLVITCIPVIFKITELVYDIIPKTIIQRLIEWLVSLRLVAIWHYLMMIVAIAAALALVYLLHKKLFSRQRLMDRRIVKSECQTCGARLAKDAQACHECGALQFRPCPACEQPTYLHARHCHHCGGVNSELK